MKSSKDTSKNFNHGRLRHLPQKPAHQYSKPFQMKDLLDRVTCKEIVDTPIKKAFITDSLLNDLAVIFYYRISVAQYPILTCIKRPDDMLFCVKLMLKAGARSNGRFACRFHEEFASAF